MDTYVAGSIFYRQFNTHKADGTPITLAGTPAISIYKDDGTIESTSGITLTVDFDSRTGMHLVKIDTSQDPTFYANSHDYSIVITAGTVDSISAVGAVVGKFRLGYNPANALQWNSGSLPTIPAAAPTAADIADAVMDEALGTHTGFLTGLLTAAGYTTPPSASSIAAAVWGTVTRSLTDKEDFSLSTAGILAIWHQLLASIATTGSIGKLIKDYLDVAVSSRTTLGAGAIRWTYTLTYDDSGLPIADADVWISTDEAGLNVIASGKTDQNGQATFDLDAGTVYVWRAKSGCNFDNPDEEIVS